MSNEDKVRAEFETTFPEVKHLGALSDSMVLAIGAAKWTGYQAATASKQREIDALNQQVLELSAQAVSAKAFIQMLADSAPVDDMDGTPFAAQEFLDLMPYTPTAALEAHDNEVAARALEEAADHEDLYDKRHVLRRMAAELRS